MEIKLFWSNYARDLGNSTSSAGIYGMNGLDLSHLSNFPAGFVTVILSMGVIALQLLLFFKQKQWIFIKEREERLL